MDKVRCSIVMATYNGEKYIKEQIDSILSNMNESDELIISDDGSTDTTIEIIKSYQDHRFRLLEGPKKGVKQNFANGISNAKGEYIFLADQDDIWLNGKIDILLNIFDERNCSLVIHDCIVTDDNLNTVIDSFFRLRKSGNGMIKNIIKNSYIGCCMCFKKELVKYILPIPENIEMHDQWIGILAETKGSGSVFVNNKLIQYRRHEKNVSSMKHYKVSRMLMNRINLVRCLINNWRG